MDKITEIGNNMIAVSKLLFFSIIAVILLVSLATLILSLFQKKEVKDVKKEL